MRTIAGRYILEERLGAGGMGEVYRARHINLGKSFALKVIAPAFANDADLRARFEYEAHLASEISHPNIVSVVDFGEDGELGAFMVMELVHGESLLESEDREAPSVKRALDILGQVADALDHIHKRDIVHGDVKADNIMMAEEPTTGGVAPRRRRTVRLLDFGLARHLGPTEEAVSGSPHYLAPERALGGPATIATDIYALGVLAYLLFTHTLPFDGDLDEVLNAQINYDAPTLSERRGVVMDQAIEALVARAMAKNPFDRHPTAAKFRYELNTVMDMLDLGRRRTRASGSIQPATIADATISVLFDRSPFAQALVSPEGRIVVANKAFGEIAELAGDIAGCWMAETAIARAIPSLARTLARAPQVTRPVERRALMPGGGEIVLWIGNTGIANDLIHLIVRVGVALTENASRDSRDSYPNM